jgi:glycosyltransferase involved in cell wall biosynthesis
VVSDDATIDKTGDIVNKLRDRYQNIHFLRQPENLGVGAATVGCWLNQKSEFTVRLDSDGRLRPPTSWSFRTF